MLADKEYLTCATIEKLYEEVRIYLEARIKSCGMETVSSEGEISTREEFNHYEGEIICRYINACKKMKPIERRPSDYMILFQDMLMKAGILEHRVYDTPRFEDFSARGLNIPFPKQTRISQ